MSTRYSNSTIRSVDKPINTLQGSRNSSPIIVAISQKFNVVGQKHFFFGSIIPPVIAVIAVIAVIDQTITSII